MRRLHAAMGARQPGRTTAHLLHVVHPRQRKVRVVVVGPGDDQVPILRDRLHKFPAHPGEGRARDAVCAQRKAPRLCAAPRRAGARARHSSRLIPLRPPAAARAPREAVVKLLHQARLPLLLLLSLPRLARLLRLLPLPPPLVLPLLLSRHRPLALELGGRQVDECRRRGARGPAAACPPCCPRRCLLLLRCAAAACPGCTPCRHSLGIDCPWRCRCLLLLWCDGAAA